MNTTVAARPSLAGDPVRVVDSLVGALAAAQNRDGGWGAAKGRTSDTEATSLATLALSGVTKGPLARTVGDGVEWLIERQNADGGWPPKAPVRESSWTTALATLALGNLDPGRQAALRGARWLIHQEGRGLGWLGWTVFWLFPRMRPTELNPDLKGWPWRSRALSWVEPTAYALMALKKLGPSIHESGVQERIRQGELLIYDRMCQGGGWNYGNTRTLGENLAPYPDTTALALIALQDHGAREANQQSLEKLRQMLDRVDSGLTLSWSTLCFALYGVETAELRRRLVREYEATRFLGRTRTLALALLALTDGSNTFRV